MRGYNLDSIGHAVWRVGRIHRAWFKQQCLLCFTSILADTLTVDFLELGCLSCGLIDGSKSWWLVATMKRRQCVDLAEIVERGKGSMAWQLALVVYGFFSPFYVDLTVRNCVRIVLWVLRWSFKIMNNLCNWRSETFFEQLGCINCPRLEIIKKLQTANIIAVTRTRKSGCREFMREII